MPAKSNLRLVAPTHENRTVPPSRGTNASYRKREHLTPAEIEKLIEAAAKGNRHGNRNATLILVAFRHGLRRSELAPHLEQCFSKVREISSGSSLPAALHHSKQLNWLIEKLHAVRESCE
jgi:site-specific recombinase XerD